MEGGTAYNQGKIPVRAKPPGIGHMPADSAAIPDALAGNLYHGTGYIYGINQGAGETRS